ncbi:MAG: phosphoserine phosphatase SerB [Pseudomonadota bacterium]
MSTEKKLLLCAAYPMLLSPVHQLCSDWCQREGVFHTVCDHVFDKGVGAVLSMSLSELQVTALNALLAEHTQVNALLLDAEKLADLKLFVFDMDSTLIDAEVIDELAHYADVQDEVQRITASAMRGDIDFNESFQQRVVLLKGIQRSALSDIASRLPFMPGLVSLFSGLNERGIKTAIVSGGFQYFADYLKQTLDANYAFANELEVDGEYLTGVSVGEVVDPYKKREILKRLAQEEGLELQQCVAVGDGANDLLMLEAAGIGIAFHAKPYLKERSQYHLDEVGLDALLALLPA